MSNVNKVFIIGRAGKKPEEYKTNSGETFTSLGVAVNKKIKEETVTTWIPVVFFGKTAEIVLKYIDKGHLVCIEGEISIRNKTNDAGYTYKDISVICNKLVLLPNGSNYREDITGANDTNYSKEQLKRDFQSPLNDEIPF